MPQAQNVFVVTSTSHVSGGTIVTVSAVCTTAERAAAFAAALKALHPNNVYAVDMLPLIEG